MAYGFGLDQLNVAKSIIGPKLGTKLTNPINSVTQFSARIKSLSTILTGLPGTQLEANVDMANSNEFTRQNSLQAMQAREDPQLSVDWIAYVADPTKELNLPAFYIDTIQLPSVSFESSPVFRNGRAHNYAGSVSLSSLSAGIFTGIKADSFSAVSTWLAQVYDIEKGHYGVPSKYKKTIYVWLYDARRRVVCELVYYGCWPTQFSGYNLEASGSTPLITQLDLSVDSMSINAMDAASFTTTDGSSTVSSTNPIASQVQGVFKTISTGLNKIGF